MIHIGSGAQNFLRVRLSPEAAYLPPNIILTLNSIVLSHQPVSVSPEGLSNGFLSQLYPSSKIPGPLSQRT